MVERSDGIRKVRGSRPLGSTYGVGVGVGAGVASVFFMAGGVVIFSGGLPTLTTFGNASFCKAPEVSAAGGAAGTGGLILFFRSFR